MLVPVRTIADRFIFSNANLKYLATTLPKGSLERSVQSTGWTVRQTLGHLAGTQDEYYAPVVRRWLHGEHPARDPDHDVDAFNARIVEQYQRTPLPEIIAILDRSLAALVEMFERVDEAKLAEPFAPWPPLEVLDAWSRHIESHAPGLVEAVPEFKEDPMVLNWVLGIDFAGEDARQWQVRLAHELRALFELQEEA